MPSASAGSSSNRLDSRDATRAVRTAYAAGCRDFLEVFLRPQPVTSLGDQLRDEDGGPFLGSPRRRSTADAAVDHEPLFALAAGPAVLEAFGLQAGEGELVGNRDEREHADLFRRR